MCIRICIVGSSFTLLIVNVFLLSTSSERVSCNEINLYHYTICAFRYEHINDIFQINLVLENVTNVYEYVYLVRQACEIWPLNEQIPFDFIFKRLLQRVIN